MKSLLQTLALKLWPELAQRTGLARASALNNLVIAIWGIPFSLIGILWLALITDLDVLQANLGMLATLLLLGFLFNRYPFELQLQIRPGVVATSSGTLFFIPVLSAIFHFGPTALWLSAILSLLRGIYLILREPQLDDRWAQFGTLTSNLSSGLISVLPGLWLYEVLGGPIPVQALDAGLLLPGLAFMLVYWLAPFVLLLPMLQMVVQDPELVGDRPGAGREFLLSVFFSSSITNLAVPFVFLGAALYAVAGSGYYIFFLLGILLASMLANNLSDSANERNQRARELAILESLGRDIITADPDHFDLAALLKRHLPGMFIFGQALVWLEPGRELYRSPPLQVTIETILGRMPDSPGPVHLYDAPLPGAEASRESVFVPIEADSGERLGGVYFDFRQRGHSKVKDFVPALQSLASQVASAQYRQDAYREALQKERMANELALAGRIQANFLPARVPELAGYEIAASLTPALQTSGDFYDFIPLPDGRLGIVVADVADKGTGAALFMALTRTLLRTYALEYPDEPARVFERVNRRVHQDTQAQLFITTFYGIVDPNRHTVTYVNGGHNAPYILHAPDETGLQALNSTGMPIGILEESQWRVEQAEFPPGAAFVLYTDGVTEAQNAAQEFFQETPLIEAVRARLADTAPAIHAGILDAIRAFVGDAPQFDDITLMVVKRG